MSESTNKKRFFIGIDVGKHHIKTGIVGDEGRVYAQLTKEVECQDLAMLTEQIHSLVQQLQQADSSHAVSSIGIGLPAMVTKDMNRIALSMPLPFLNGLDFRKHISQTLGLPVAIDTDANVAAYGEMLLGAAQAAHHFIYINIGSRVGASIVLDRRIFRGADGFAGELGHVSVDPDGRKCACGAAGCLERYVSASSISQRVFERLNLNPTSALQIITDRHVTAQDVTAAAALGDKMASVIISEVGRYLGVAISNLIDLLNVELVVLGGGVTASGEVLLVPTLDEVKRRSLAPPYDSCQIVAGALGPAARVIGSALMARDLFNA
jgi:glucokinase-like ROK family protein